MHRMTQRDVTKSLRGGREAKSEGYNIIIRPDKAVAEAAVALSDRLAFSNDCYFTLGNRKLPHITLFQSQFPKRNLGALKDTIRRIAESSSQFTVQMGEIILYSDYAAQGFVFWNCEYTYGSEIYLLQRQIVRKTNQLREGLVLPGIDSLDRGRLTPDQVVAIPKYGSLPPNLIMLSGKPAMFHITITRIKDQVLETRQITDQEAVFKVDSISIGRLGAHGTVTGILEEFRLGRT